MLKHLVVFLACAATATSAETALDRYVRTPDAHFKYQLAKTIPGIGYTAYVIDLTSQQWRTPAEVDHSLWKHWITIIKPDEIKGTTGLLFISGGSVTAAAPERANPAYVDMALSTRSVVAELSGIPNEPVTFTGETSTRNEDQIITYSWVKYLKTGDETWPLRLPMTKAVMRAMDTVTAFTATVDTTVDHYFLAGASKRGWATWTAAAVDAIKDKRVIGISPLVIDVLNLPASLDNHFRSLGAYSDALNDYKQMNLMSVQHTPAYDKLMAIEDPISYRDRYTMPKLIINAAGDQYFLPDSSKFYFDRLPSEKYLRYVPNTNHSLANSDARESLTAFYDAVIHNQPRPKFKWTFEKNGDIKVTATDKPTEVKMWAATNPAKRDFRLMTLGPKYEATPLTSIDGKTYTARLAKPVKGWSAFFVELTFPGPGKYPFKFTTAVRITPDTFAYEAEKGKAKITGLP